METLMILSSFERDRCTLVSIKTPFEYISIISTALALRNNERDRREKYSNKIPKLFY